MSERRFVIGVKRQARNLIPATWLEILAACPGVHIVGATGNRAVVEMDDEGLATVRGRLGEWVHIEAETIHVPNAAESLSGGDF